MEERGVEMPVVEWVGGLRELRELTLLLVEEENRIGVVSEDPLAEGWGVEVSLLAVWLEQESSWCLVFPRC